MKLYQDSRSHTYGLHEDYLRITWELPCRLASQGNTKLFLDGRLKTQYDGYITRLTLPKMILLISQWDDRIEPWLLAYRPCDMPLSGQIVSQQYIARTDAFDRAVTDFNFCFSS